MEEPEAGDAVARVLNQAQQRQHVFHVRGIENLSPPNSRTGCCGG
jgi:hypothetical protein